MMRDFSELPADVLYVIAGMLTPPDLVRFGAVCGSWRLASLKNPKHCKLPSLLPVLLLPSTSTSTSTDDEHHNQQTDDENTEEEGNQQTDDDDDDDDNDYDDYESQQSTEEEKKTNTIKRSFYSLYDGKVHDWQLDVGGNCRSSSHGWLVVTTEADQNYSVRLLNPFKSVNNVIELPPLTAFKLNPGYIIWDSSHLLKAAFSAGPSSCSNPRDIVVMAIYGCFRLSFCRPGDQAWTALPDEWDGFQDVIYYNGLFYAILQTGKLFAIEIDPIHSKLKDFKVLIDVPCDNKNERKYIVESAGELLQVKRKVGPRNVYVFNYKTVYFKVFKLKQTGSRSRWVETRTLNGRILFLGHNASISLSASDLPGCKPNCIYFTDDFEEVFLVYPSLGGPHDIGIYNLEDGSIEPHYPMQTNAITPTDAITPHSIWIQPTP